MLLDGIWFFQVAGIYGWERISTAFIEKGRYLSGNASMFSQGTYVSNGNKVKIKLQVTQHGKKRAIFGEKRKQFSVVMTAKHDGKKIQGRVSLSTISFNRLSDVLDNSQYPACAVLRPPPK